MNEKISKKTKGNFEKFNQNSFLIKNLLKFAIFIENFWNKSFKKFSKFVIFSHLTFT